MGSILSAWLPPTPRQLRQLEETAQAQAAAASLTRNLPPQRPAEHEGEPKQGIAVSLADRWYVLGTTGTGKTHFARRLVRELLHIYPHAALYVLDSKGSGDFAGWPGRTESETAPRPLLSGGVQIWTPPDDNTGEYDRWLQGILKARAPAILLIDELSSLAENESGTAYPMALKRLLKQGRSLGICLVILTQEAAYIPRQIKTQVSHFVYFGLQEDDHGEQQAARLLGHADPIPPRRLHGFWYRRLLPRRGPATEYDGASDFFGAAA